MNKPITIQCPLCEASVPPSQMFMEQTPEAEPRPFICVKCVRGLYWSIPKKNDS